MTQAEAVIAPPLRILGGVAAGSQAYALAEMLKRGLAAQALIHVAISDREARLIAEALPFFAPDAEVLYFPAWDCLPYDRVSPNSAISAERMRTLGQLSAQASAGKPRILLTTVNAVLQKLPPREVMQSAFFRLDAGKKLDREALLAFFAANGYIRVGKAMETGEYSLRGSIIDLIPPADGEQAGDGVRIDLFGDDIESLRRFDPMTQLSTEKVASVSLHPISEMIFSEARIERFRTRYRDLFGAVSKEDPLYEAISSGSRYPGMEHWLPLFYEQMESLFDYLPGAIATLDIQASQAIAERHETILDYYQARVASEKAQAKSGMPYHPLPPEQLYLMEGAWERRLEALTVLEFTPFEREAKQEVSLGVRSGVNFAALRNSPEINPFEQLCEFAAGKREAKKATLLACLSPGSRERLSALLAAQGAHCVRVEQYAEMKGISGKTIALAVLPLERGFETPDAAVVSEQDLLGDRVIRSKPKKRKAEAFLAEAANFTEGELVVHREHGIGRFDGLVTLDVMGAQHDCLKICYEGDDRLFLPVENIDLITRYGSEEEGVKLDKLGGASWQARKARLKERIKLAAEQLIKTAAERAIREAPELAPHATAYDAFCARFPYAETEDQERSIEEVLEDMRSGHPMDRLICGDVGFGKTEVALRAAFVAVTSPSPFQGEGWGEGSLIHADAGDRGANPHPALSPEGRGGKMQVALIAPTTLLARQHYKNFRERFEGFSITVRQLSRLVSAKEQKETREGLKDGSVDIVIGTHALLAKGIEFNSLGLVIVDEEQHFGVAQKEKLKELKAGVHVLTLSATPIPRTMQMALTGVRSLSLITTPPVDRLAVRSFVMPFDPVVLREAIMREQHRGGRVFLVTPRIQDIGDLSQKMRELVPEIKIAVAHGQMPPSELDAIMNDFYDGKYDMLLSTAIIESGLDIPTANTMIIHRADRFGLAQLYQLRGRVGRGKIRAYAYFLLPAQKVLSQAATRRLEVMQTLDSLGAGFTLASHDMDIRGFGNLVGEEQSGHIREVGIELYQQMLAEAVEALKRKEKTELAAAASSEEWSPQINLGMSVLIPEEYVSDLQLRLSLYRRAAYLKDEAEIEAFAAEMIDRFGPLPEEVEHLLAIVRIKQLCRAASVDRIDVGPKGALITFRESGVSPEKLLAYISKHPTTLKLRPDQKLFYAQEWKDAAAKIGGVKPLLANLCAAIA